MKVSIITTVKNDKEGFNETLRSVSDQSYGNIEHIVVDGSDEDHKIDQEKIENLKFIKQKDSSPYEGMNTGIENVTGDVVALLHAGDIFVSKDSVSQIMQIFENKKVDAVYGDIVYHAKNNSEKIVRKWKSVKLEKDDIENGVFPPHTALIVKREVYEKTGKFDIKFKITADADMMIRMFRLVGFKAHYLNKTILSMRIGGRSNRNLFSVIKGNVEFLKILRKQKVKNPVLKMLKKVLSKIRQYF